MEALPDPAHAVAPKRARPDDDDGGSPDDDDAKVAYDTFVRKWEQVLEARGGIGRKGYSKAELKAEADARRAAHAALSGKTLPSRIRWNKKKTSYEVTLHSPGRKTVTALLHTLAEAEEFAADAERASPKSHTKQYVAKRARMDANAAKRAKDIATHGDDGALERRVLLETVVRELRPVAGKRGVRMTLHVMPDGTWADFLVRFDDERGAADAGGANDAANAPWLSVQLKTTTKMYEHTKPARGGRKERVKMGYKFSRVRGYTGARVLCVCEMDGRVWLLDGAALDAHKACDLTISYNQARKTVNPIKWCNRMMPTSWEAVFETLRADYADALMTRAPAAAASSAAPPRTHTLMTLDEAEVKLASENHGIEYAGIREWVRCVHDGFEPAEVNFDPSRRTRLPATMRDDPLRYRLLKNGNVFAYPEGQNTKTDALLYYKSDGFDEEKEWKLQFKTPVRVRTNTRGWYVNLQTNAGTDDDGKKLYDNQYTVNDNHLYVSVLCRQAAGAIPKTTLIWECTCDWMRDHKLFNTASGVPLQGFGVHAESEAHNSVGCKEMGPPQWNSKWRTAMTEPGMTRRAYDALESTPSPPTLDTESEPDPELESAPEPESDDDEDGYPWWLTGVTITRGKPPMLESDSKSE